MASSWWNWLLWLIRSSSRKSWRKCLDPRRVALTWRIIASGYVPEYLYEEGRLADMGLSFAELQRRDFINARAQAADSPADFSRLIRAAGNVQLGEPYRSDARGHVGFDDAYGIRPIFKGTDIHRHVRPPRPCNTADESSDARIAVSEQNVASVESRRHRSIGSWFLNRFFDRLREIPDQCIDEAVAGSDKDR